MAIFLIRHGETASNAARVVQTPDIPLSPRGLRQAQALARRLADAGITAILSSDLARARMTAECLRTATGATLRLEPGLQERNYGDIRGRAYATLGVDIFAPDYAPPGGESWAVFHQRVNQVWGEVTRAAADAAGHLAIVTHGLVCYSLALRHLRLPEGTAAPMRWANTSVTVIDASRPWSVRLLNCTAHLTGEIADDSQTPSSG
jgi:probable phosphoglycerate mutase